MTIAKRSTVVQIPYIETGTGAVASERVHTALQEACSSLVSLVAELLHAPVVESSDLFAFEQTLHSAVPGACLDTITAAVIEDAVENAGRRASPTSCRLNPRPTFPDQRLRRDRKASRRRKGTPASRLFLEASEEAWSTQGNRTAREGWKWPVSRARGTGHHRAHYSSACQ